MTATLERTRMPATPTPASSAWGARVALGGLLVATALLYLWGLGNSGWANAYYSAAAQAGASSWKALLFGATDAAGGITLDKGPAAGGGVGASGEIFGVRPWGGLGAPTLEGGAAGGGVGAGGGRPNR